MAWLRNEAGILAFSQQKHGLFCCPCIVFRQDLVGKGGHVETGFFVKKAFRRYKDFAENWKLHKNSGYHGMAMERLSAFKSTMGGVKI